MEEQPHVQRLADGAELLHQCVIETGKMSVLERRHNRARESHGAGFDRIGRVLAPLDIHLRKNIEGVFDKAVCGFEAGPDERVVDFVERATSCSLSLPPHAARPIRRISSLLVNDTSALSRPAVAGMLFDQRHENFVRERSGLTEPRVGTDDDIFFRDSPIEFDLLGVGRRAFGVMAKQRAGNAQQRIFHVELVADESARAQLLRASSVAMPS